MRRTIFTADHEDFRAMVRLFVAAEVTPNLAEWDAAGRTGRAFYEAAGKAGLLGFAAEPEYGGLGVRDLRYSAVIIEELVAVGAVATSMNVSGLNDLVLPYLDDLLTPTQKATWLPGICAGTTITALALSEPGAGSDLRALSTVAVGSADGWLLTGSKTFISNGSQADVALVAARTGTPRARDSITLFLVPTNLPGFSRSEPLSKTGLKSQDTAQLFFDEVALTPDLVVGEVGGGWGYLMSNLPTERMSIALTSAAACRTMLDLTLPHARSRTAFGTAIGSFQHNTFLLAELATEVQIAEVFLDRCLELLLAGELTPEDAAMAKWWVSELQQKVGYRCQQLFGGYGVMTEYPIARAVVDGRASTIYGGSTEIMKQIIGRSLGL